jgi:uncharacterized protein YjbI with pentapeptide repeats
VSELTRKEIFDLMNRPGIRWLPGVDLSKANLSEAILYQANLSEANLAGATMPDGTKHA